VEARFRPREHAGRGKTFPCWHPCCTDTRHLKAELQMRNSIRITRWILGCAALGVVALAPSIQAEAATMTVNGYTLGEQVRVGGLARRGTVATAEFDVTYEGLDGFSYCVDIAQDIGLGTSAGWETRAVDSSESLIRAAWLVDTFRPSFDSMLAPGSDTYAMGGHSRATLIAALQVSVWEVMAEASRSYDLTRGRFSLEVGTSAGVMNLARTFLGALDEQALAGFGADATWAYSSTRQDQLVVVNPIPEPSSVLLFAIGAGLVGFVARRRAG
jgi:hypothetical protein